MALIAHFTISLHQHQGRDNSWRKKTPLESQRRPRGRYGNRFILCFVFLVMDDSDLVLIQIAKPADEGGGEVKYEDCYFHASEASSFLQDLKKTQQSAKLENPVLTRHVVEFLQWYLKPSSSLSQSPEFKLLEDLSSSDYIYRPPSDYLKEEEKMEKVLEDLVSQKKKRLGEFLQQAIIAANLFKLQCLVHFLAKYLRNFLLQCESPASLREKLDFPNDSGLSDGEQLAIWTRNHDSTIEREVEDGDLISRATQLRSFWRPAPVLSPSPNEDRGDNINRCSAEGCSVRFGLTQMKYQCLRKGCKTEGEGRGFCGEHLKWVHLPKFDEVEENTGLFSSFMSFVFSRVSVCDDCYRLVKKEERCRNAFEAFQLMGLEIPLLNRALSVCESWSVASKKSLGLFGNLQFKLPGDEWRLEEKRSLWNNREYFQGHPRWLVQLVRAVDFEEKGISEEVDRLLCGKRKISCRSCLCGVHFSGEFEQRLQRQVPFLFFYFLLNSLLTFYPS